MSPHPGEKARVRIPRAAWLWLGIVLGISVRLVVGN